MFTMVIAGAETFSLPKECIESAKFITEIPKDSDARTKDAGTTLIVQGNILTAVDGGSPDYTWRIAHWSTIPSGRADCYRDVTLTKVRFGIVVREYTIPDAFVVDYNENFDDEVGTFTLMIKQKKDQIAQVSVCGGFLR